MEDLVLNRLREITEAHKQAETAKDGTVKTNPIMEYYINIGKYIGEIIDFKKQNKLNEYKSTFHLNQSNDIEPWVEQLAVCLYDTIKGEWQRNNSNYFEISNKQYKQLPQIPFLKHYSIKVEYYWDDRKPEYEGKIKSYNKLTETLYVELIINKTTHNLKGVIYSFIYHEFLHAYQTMIMGENNMADYINSSRYKEILNIDKETGENQTYYQYIKEPLAIIKDILYHTHKLEQNAYNSQSIGDHLYNMKGNPEYIKLSKNDKLKYLYMGKKYEELNKEYDILEKELNDMHNLLFLVLLNELNNNLGTKFNTKEQILKVLRQKIDKVYKGYVRKVGRWITEQKIKESGIWFE